MRPHSYTELFFLDEATAFAAGHRPCAECRNADYKRFRELWVRCHGEPVSADIIDYKLQDDRRASPGVKRTYEEHPAALPDGAYIAINDRAWLVMGKQILAWSPTGYVERQKRPTSGRVVVLTPKSTTAVLSAGYRVTVHPTAE